MPTYVYACKQCEIEFEIVQHMNDLACADCPVCNTVSKYRVPQPVMVFNKTPSTMGGLADKQRSEMGRYKYEDTIQKMANSRGAEYCGHLPDGAEYIAKEKKNRPWYRPDRDTADLSLTKLTPEQKTKYIMEGKKPIGLT